MGVGCDKDSGGNMEDEIIVRVIGSSTTESGKYLGEELALVSERFECWSSEERWQGGLSINSDIRRTDATSY